MGALQYEYVFSNAQAVGSNNNTVVSTNVNQKNNAATQKDAFGVAMNSEIGGMTVVVTLTTAITGANGIIPYLKTCATNNLNAAGTILATFNSWNDANTVGQTQSWTAPKGTKRLKYLGMIYVNTLVGTTAGNMSAYMKPGAAQIID